MAFTSVAQYKEIVQSLLDYIHQPRENRHTNDSPAGELYTAGGDKITGLKLKFFIEDDGGTWDSEGLIKPSFIWDMKKIAGGSIIDSGNNTTHLNLSPHNLRETEDGLYFLDSENSFLESEMFDNTSMANKNVALNIWFRPSLKNIVKTSTLFVLNAIVRDSHGNRGYTPIIKIDIHQDSNNLQTLHVSKLITGGYMQYYSSGIKLFTEDLNNFQFFASNSKLTYLINGKIGYITLPSYVSSSHQSSSYSQFTIGKGFKGEISYITYLITTETISSTILLLQNKLRYPLPRSRQLVDLSDYFEVNGKDLLMNVGTISKSIENLRGQLFIKTNSIKVGN